MDRVEKAEQLFRQGYNCAQSVVLAFADKVDVDEKTLEHISAPFGGGVGRMREICGAVSGMMMLVGLVRKPDTTQRGAKDKLYAEERELADKFKEQAGSIVCRDLIAAHPHGNTANVNKPHCQWLVGLAAGIVADSGLFEPDED